MLLMPLLAGLIGVPAVLALLSLGVAVIPVGSLLSFLRKSFMNSDPGLLPPLLLSSRLLLVMLLLLLLLTPPAAESVKAVDAPKPQLLLPPLAAMPLLWLHR
jgi:hypothetical protein